MPEELETRQLVQLLDGFRPSKWSDSRWNHVRNAGSVCTPSTLSLTLTLGTLGAINPIRAEIIGGWLKTILAVIHAMLAKMRLDVRRVITLVKLPKWLCRV